MIRRFVESIRHSRSRPYVVALAALSVMAFLLSAEFLLAYAVGAPLIAAAAGLQWFLSSRGRRDAMGRRLRAGEHAAYVRVNQSPELVRLVWHDDSTSRTG